VRNVNYTTVEVHFTVRWLLWNVKPLPVQNQVYRFVATHTIETALPIQQWTH